MKNNPIWNKSGNALHGYAMEKWLAARGDIPTNPRIQHKFGFDWTPKTEEHVLFCRANRNKISEYTRYYMDSLGSELSKKYWNLHEHHLLDEMEMEMELKEMRCGITTTIRLGEHFRRNANPLDGNVK